jgi:hypothetical protein
MNGSSTTRDVARGIGNIEQRRYQFSTVSRCSRGQPGKRGSSAALGDNLDGRGLRYAYPEPRARLEAQQEIGYCGNIRQ